MKIALVNPPQFSRYSQPPMGLATIAAVLEKNGYAVEVVDAAALRLSEREIISRVDGYDIVGLTAMTPTINRAVKLAAVLKAAQPGRTIILGGAHATLLPKETLETAPEIDIIIRGEGEDVLIDLLTAIEQKNPLHTVSGISFRENGRIVSNPVRNNLVELDTLPFLAYHLLPFRKYRPHPPHGRELPFAAIITSRGCPYHCSYCSKPVFGAKFRAQSPERVLAEIEYLQKQYGVREIAVYDDVFTLNKKRAFEIAEGIVGRRLKLSWTCESRVNLVDKDLLKMMRRSGCYAVAYGIESASPGILKTLHKDITLEEVEAAIRTTREAGLQTIGYFMIGSPGETPETIGATIDFAKKLKLDFAQFAITTPFPGTELYDIYLKDRGEAVPWENFTYGGTGGSVTPVFDSAQLSRGDLQQWMSRAYRRFYLRPAYIWQRLTRLHSAGDLKVNIQGLMMLVNSLREDKG